MPGTPDKFSVIERKDGNFMCSECGLMSRNQSAVQQHKCFTIAGCVTGQGGEVVGGSGIAGGSWSAWIPGSPDPRALKDSGDRCVTETGMMKDPSYGRGRFELISPIALRRLAQQYERGVSKYSARNWEKGGPISGFVGSAMRHLVDYMEGDRSEDHLAAVMWQVSSAAHIETMIERGQLPREYDDMPCYLVNHVSKDAEP